MLTRGILRSVVPPTIAAGFVLRASGGPSILKELSNEQLALDVDDAVRLGARGDGRPGLRRRRVRDPVGRQPDPARRRGLPPRDPGPRGDRGRQGARPRRALPRAWRPGSAPSSAPRSSRRTTARRASSGSTAGCPVPVVMAGGKKLPELDALTMACRAIAGGRRGRRHGPQHLPERRPDRDAPGGPQGRPRRRQPGRGLRRLPRPAR